MVYEVLDTENPRVKMMRAPRGKNDTMRRLFEAFAEEMATMSGGEKRLLTDVDDYTCKARYESWYVVMADEIAGVAVVREDDCHYLRHFYIRPEFRHCGIGLAAARAVIGKAAGRWRVSTMDYNESAQSFWQYVFDSFQMVHVVEGRRPDNLGPQYEFEVGVL